jgi:4-hydroxybenzoate polyprenyltransferase
MLITLLNDGALISIGYDLVKPNPIPEQWNLPRLFIVASVMGAVAMGSSLLMLAAALDSNNPNGIFAGICHVSVHTHMIARSLLFSHIYEMHTHTCTPVFVFYIVVHVLCMAISICYSNDHLRADFLWIN